MSNKSIEPVLNESASGATPLSVTSMSEVGAALHRTAVATSDTATEITMTTGYSHIEIQNLGTTVLYYGGPAVTSAKGIAITPYQSKFFSKVKSDFSFYIVNAAGETGNLRIVEYA